MIRFILCFIAIAASAPLAAETCHHDTPCQIGVRSYHVLEPDGWDRTNPLPVLLHFHGWQRDGKLIVNHNRIASATRKRGVLLVAPNGARKTWDFWRADTPDVPFAEAVLEDIAKRYPIDAGRVFVSGYSYGGAMAWRFACQSGSDIRALLAISGTLDQREPCPEAPIDARHVHGLNDPVLTYPMGPEGDVTHAVALWRSMLGCGAPTVQTVWQAREWLTFTRTAWEDCTAGAVILDTHPGGHFIPHGWIARQLDELLHLPPTYP